MGESFYFLINWAFDYLAGDLRFCRCLTLFKFFIIIFYIYYLLFNICLNNINIFELR